MNNILIQNINKIHTTPMGADRISRNLNLQDEDPVLWCKNAVENADLIIRKGKNWYVYFNGTAITINARSYTIITAHKIKPKYRVMNVDDYSCLNEFLYQAIYVPKEAPQPPRSIIDDNEISIYTENFGLQSGDLGVVAEQNSRIIGAAWTRIIPAYGHIDEHTPELAISILPEFRGYGIGTKLMTKLFNLLQENGYSQTSLSVQNENPAVRFYKRLGYEIVEDSSRTEQGDLLMVKKL